MSMFVFRVRRGYPKAQIRQGAKRVSTPTVPATYREERLARFRRCCRFRSFHLAFWLVLSFARDALVHLNAIGCSLAPVSERPDPSGRFSGHEPA